MVKIKRKRPSRYRPRVAAVRAGSRREGWLAGTASVFTQPAPAWISGKLSAPARCLASRRRLRGLQIAALLRPDSDRGMRGLASQENDHAGLVRVGLHVFAPTLVRRHWGNDLLGAVPVLEDIDERSLRPVAVDAVIVEVKRRRELIEAMVEMVVAGRVMQNNAADLEQPPDVAEHVGCVEHVLAGPQIEHGVRRA